MDERLPAHVEAVLRALEGAGHTARLVGGCVRDRLAGREPEDWDICTCALPEQVKASLPGVETGEEGIRFGSLVLKTAHGPVEVTTFRAESGYRDHRRPGRVEFIRDLERDLRRRDFTMNAIAQDLNGGLTDPFGGREDIAAGLIRCVGDPDERFAEDALRILRALRFASVLEMEIEPETAAAVLRHREGVLALSKRVRARETEKLLKGAQAEKVLQRFPDVIPELR